MTRLYIWIAVIVVTLIALAVRWNDLTTNYKLLFFVVLALAGARIGMAIRDMKKK